MTFKCSTCNTTFKSTEEAMDHYKDNPLHEIRYFQGSEEKSVVDEFEGALNPDGNITQEMVDEALDYMDNYRYYQFKEGDS